MITTTSAYEHLKAAAKDFTQYAAANESAVPDELSTALDHLRQEMDVLEESENLPAIQIGSDLEQQIVIFQRDVVFSETYGVRGTSVFGSPLMDRHLTALEEAARGGMTLAASKALQASVSAFEVFMSWTPAIRLFPFDCGKVLDDYLRLFRLAEGGE